MASADVKTNKHRKAGKSPFKQLSMVTEIRSVLGPHEYVFKSLRFYFTAVKVCSDVQGITNSNQKFQ